jgi:quinol monooxygenase YgiN
MYVQMITMRVPPDEMARLRHLISQDYLPALRARTGFVAAHLLEQVDDANVAHLLVYWNDQTAVERGGKTGVLADSPESIAARLPGLRIQRQSYVVRVAMDQSQIAPADG